MTTLDTPVHRAYLDRIRPDARPDAVIADIGGGDGRNAVPWLEAGFHRIIVVDPIASALMRLRQRIAASNPEWLPWLFVDRGRCPSSSVADGELRRGAVGRGVGVFERGFPTGSHGKRSHPAAQLPHADRGPGPRRLAADASVLLRWRSRHA